MRKVRALVQARQGIPPAIVFTLAAAVTVFVTATAVLIPLNPPEHGLDSLFSLDVRIWPCLVTGLTAALLSAWILTLRPGDWTVRLFAAGGASTYLFCMGAAGFFLPLDFTPAVISTLVIVNSLGATAFGLAMIALFSLYPRRLPGAPILIATSLVFFGGWALLSIFGPLGIHIQIHRVTFAEMMLIIVLTAVQIFASRANPVQRAIAIWLGACVGIGAGGFIALVAAPSAFGFAPLVPNEFGFLFFILVYAGLAVGLLRYRVFGLGRWAFQLLFNVGAALVVLVVDAVLIITLSLDPGRAIGASLFLVALAYLPMRGWIWQHFSRRARPEESRLFRAVIDVALQPTGAQRETAWRALLRDMFAPLEVGLPGGESSDPRSDTDGRVMHVSGPAGFADLILYDRDQGRSLFAPEDAATARELAALVEYLGESRTAYDRGATYERSRIARDIHDNIGAQLLTALHAPPGGRKDELIRATIGDLRDVIRNAEGEPVGLDAMLADLRAETADRVEMLDLELDWRMDFIRTDPPRRASVQVIRAVVREAVSNALRHAGASRISVSVGTTGDLIRLEIADDGRGFATESINEGRGLGNMKARVEALGGSFSMSSGPSGTRLETAFPAFEAAPETPDS